MDDIFTSDDDELETAKEIGEAYAHVLDDAADEQPFCVRLSEFLHKHYQPKPIFKTPPTKPAILLVDDDRFEAIDYADFLQLEGFSVFIANSPEAAFLYAEQFRQFAAVVIDIRMPPGKLFGEREAGGGYRTGLVFAQEFINHLPDSIFFALTRSTDSHVEAWFTHEEGLFHYCRKADYEPKKFACLVKRKLQTHAMENGGGLKTFIVHGHDELAWLQLKNYLQSTLKFPEPTVLHEKPSGTRTIIEKFEKYAEDIDVAFVILTPDDFVDTKGIATGRARQNVLFELGYFVGKLKRESGRVILLSKQGVEIPSDLAGVIYIDITNGVLAAGEQIRREIEALI